MYLPKFNTNYVQENAIKLVSRMVSDSKFTQSFPLHQDQCALNLCFRAINLREKTWRAINGRDRY